MSKTEEKENILREAKSGRKKLDTGWGEGRWEEMTAGKWPQHFNSGFLKGVLPRTKEVI